MDIRELERPEEIDRYLKDNGLAMASDYSEDYFKRIDYAKKKAEKDDCFNDFIQQYKRKIWSNEWNYEKN